MGLRPKAWGLPHCLKCGRWPNEGECLRDWSDLCPECHRERHQQFVAWERTPPGTPVAPTPRREPEPTRPITLETDLADQGLSTRPFIGRRLGIGFQHNGGEQTDFERDHGRHKDE